MRLTARQGSVNRGSFAAATASVSRRAGHVTMTTTVVTTQTNFLCTANVVSTYCIFYSVVSKERSVLNLVICYCFPSP